MISLVSFEQNPHKLLSYEGEQASKMFWKTYDRQFKEVLYKLDILGQSYMPRCLVSETVSDSAYESVIDTDIIPSGMTYP